METKFRCNFTSISVGKMKSTVNDDYGPRTLPPGEAAARKARKAE